MNYDIAVIGGGHAGIEAANICAQKELQVVLITTHLDLIGQMSCNPAIGGIAKGNIVREVDALGGLMGRVIDKAGIHFRMLNQTKGSAVWGPRAQADKNLYKKYVRKEIDKNKKISLYQGMVTEIITEGGLVKAIKLDSTQVIQTRAVIVATGTFLNGRAHIGLESFSAGRTGEPASTGLTKSIEKLGIRSGRLKTGTSPRIDGRSVDFSKLIPQSGDQEPWPFSFSTQETIQNRVKCWISKTNSQTHKIILENKHLSPLYRGKITSVGPRYCPSIEDKVLRFGERDGHSLFLEPESLDNYEMYLNGLSTSLPFEIQEMMVRSIPGFEEARILRPGYGIEYDYFQPLQLRPTLESKYVKNLYFAGQINGTSGYEEAACQGLIAGMNAALNLLNQGEIVLGRETSYTGVLIDDLITRGTEEPYRMFTSRAEYRLMLRQDNSDERLMPIAKKYGFIEDEFYDSRKKVWEEKKKSIKMFSGIRISRQVIQNALKMEIKNTVRADEFLRRPEFTIHHLIECLELLKEEINTESEEIVKQIKENRSFSLGVESDVKYEGFVKKQLLQVQKLRQLEEAIIPEDFDYESVPGMLSESRTKLITIKPKTLGQALRISGVTPADISILAMCISRHRNNKSFHVKQ
ncbi:tRNA uridine-5-carboxymethylaminomethyl(34) synthesis enzyme MnmG [Chitinispirillales bacterium ANBcel5]|uniref:tRNA uridine-5-carboxymethylaminomethyl(34) synthesis enzyme MnmG n=1 Tax=Cellulosispirillum alkaliphilum TaxID=3039283 RepID=UPI002A52AB9E|nr:tRNA uridine-5-carboxymethylaminomethyl(34) synthesis enzyme MnmG [Chitinispirillales bacterium ANBcel5]